jgi:hypothetical protein
LAFIHNRFNQAAKDIKNVNFHKFGFCQIVPDCGGRVTWIGIGFQPKIFIRDIGTIFALYRCGIKIYTLYPISVNYSAIIIIIALILYYIAVALIHSPVADYSCLIVMDVAIHVGYNFRLASNHVPEAYFIDYPFKCMIDCLVVADV